jgi:hypothetical protein
VFLAHGREYRHYRGVLPRPASPGRTGLDHAPVVGWRQAADAAVAAARLGSSPRPSHARPVSRTARAGSLQFALICWLTAIGTGVSSSRSADAPVPPKEFRESGSSNSKPTGWPWGRRSLTRTRPSRNYARQTSSRISRSRA